MFTLTQIKDAHSTVKTGADFPAYIQMLIQIGVTGYSTFVADGHTNYSGNGGYNISTDQKYPAMEIATNSNSEKYKHFLKIHQQGQTDYPTFCKHSAETGVEKWTVDMKAMTCSYYDLEENVMLVENIPVHAK